MSLLQLEYVKAYYGPSQALFDVSMSMEEGEVVALLGRNGMGKSTTIKVICRLLQHAGGRVLLEGEDIAGLASHQAARRGIGLVPEGRRCFPNLTVFENLIAAARPGDWGIGTVNELFPRLGERMEQSAATLSVGEQQMLAIGRALMNNPRLLLLDEATEGLAPVVRQEIWAAIAHLKVETGMSILVVDKSLKELSRVADRAVILEKGCTVWEGDFASLTQQVSQRHIGV